MFKNRKNYTESMPISSNCLTKMLSAEDDKAKKELNNQAPKFILN